MDEKGHPLLGDWPIEIGLWVGSDASPNRLGGKGDTGDDTAVTRVRRFRKHGDRAPAPIKNCPWCGTPFSKESFACVPNDHAPRNLEIRCDNAECEFTGDRPLPLLTVDETICRRLPAFVIATVDKFATLPWVGASGAFFGHVDRFEASNGFFGPADGPGRGRKLDNDFTLDPPDLIIQDELHLISGPLGTVAGLYETAIDRLASRRMFGKVIRPKIVASTATVRRAAGQIRALFDREHTAVFPPPGIDRTDSFFARTVNDERNPPRWYLGLAAQGRGPKLVFLRALTALLAVSEALYEREAGQEGRNPADPYMTALCYFNALRELGGARRIVEDEVRDRVARYGDERRRVDPADSPFRNRSIREPMELTSRVSTDQVAEAKRRLEQCFGSDEVVDVALATNMISVGLDITRLGLMLVQGQPKTAAEYIQATSRVGRDVERPGLVVTILNVHKPRDRMHYEQFCHFHRTFYRVVEATSVTPWAARALDRALAAVVVAIGRHVDPDMTPENAARQLKNYPALRQQIRDAIVSRAPNDAVAGGKAALAQAVDGLLDDWIAVADEVSGLVYTRNGGPRPLLYQPLDPALPNLGPSINVSRRGGPCEMWRPTPPSRSATHGATPSPMPATWREDKSWPGTSFVLASSSPLSNPAPWWISRRAPFSWAVWSAGRCAMPHSSRLTSRASWRCWKRS
ncbi:helicase-related protein [Caenispirillum bisanense]|uniref:helicase-related protein n=1 Tax=Caenispirillum bisanense TaxID=414052 RepID=UPI0031E2A8AC